MAKYKIQRDDTVIVTNAVHETMSNKGHRLLGKLFRQATTNCTKIVNELRSKDLSFRDVSFVHVAPQLAAPPKFLRPDYVSVRHEPLPAGSMVYQTVPSEMLVPTPVVVATPLE